MTVDQQWPQRRPPRKDILAVDRLGRRPERSRPSMDSRWGGLGTEELGALAPKTTPGPKDQGTLTDQYFHVEWKAEAERGGRSRLTGYVYNDSDSPARNVELRITAVDWAGQPGRNMVRPVGDTVPAKGRGHFDLETPSSPVFTVAVESFELVERPRGN
jgi:hypothetical protein